MQDIEIKASVRSGKSRRGELSESRRNREIPGVVYGGGKKGNVHIVVSERALLDAIKTGGMNAIIHLAHDKGKETVIVKEMQRHVVTSAVIHVDFQRVDLAKKIVVKVPVRVIGEAPGVKLHGGVFEHNLREIEIEALPAQIPQAIDIDVSSLEIGQGIKIKDVIAPEGARILDDGEQTVMHVMYVKVEVEAAPAAEGEEAAEPEVLKQGKKDEEGAEGDAKDKGEAEKKSGDKK